MFLVLVLGASAAGGSFLGAGNINAAGGSGNHFYSFSLFIRSGEIFLWK